MKLKNTISQLSVVALTALSLTVGGCASHRERVGFDLHNFPQMPTQPIELAKLEKIFNYEQVGVASWYGPRFEGRKTANGERFNSAEMTCAHRYLPFGSYLRVINLENMKEVVVRVNDRGPYIGKRVIDLSRQAAKVLEFHDDGLTKVRITRVL